MEIFAYWFHMFNSLRLISIEFGPADELQERNNQKTASSPLMLQRRMGEQLDMMDFKRGCCGTIFVIVLVISCLAINFIPNL